MTWFPSRPRMRLIVDFLQSFYARVGVHLSGAQRCVAQQLLHGAKIGSGIEHVGSEGVAERVHPKPVTPDAIQHPMHDSLDAAWPQPLSPPAHEDGAAISTQPGHRLSPELKIASEREDGPRAYWYNPLLPAFAPHLELIGEKIEIFQVHAAELGKADARGVE